MNKSWMPMVGGILSLISGGLSFIGGLLFGIAGSALLLSPNWYGNDLSELTTGLVWLFVVPYLIISIIAVIGGIYAMRRKSWGFALAGAICAILTGWAWVLGVAAVVFIAISKQEFNHIHTEYIPPPGSPPPPVGPVS